MLDELVELRQYTRQPGHRESFLDLYDTFFLKPREEVRACVPGHFRDVLDLDRFVWAQTFPNMEARRAALEKLYFVRARHRDAGKATRIDSEDVQLPRPRENTLRARTAALDWPSTRSARPPADRRFFMAPGIGQVVW